MLWLATPFVVAALISFTVKPIFLDRYLIVCIPAVALVAATTLARLRLRLVAVGALSIVVIGSLVTIHRSYGGDRTNWRDAHRLLRGLRHPRRRRGGLPRRAPGSQ